MDYSALRHASSVIARGNLLVRNPEASGPSDITRDPLWSGIERVECMYGILYSLASAGNLGVLV